MTYPGI
jgi:hypothetical protein